MFVLNVLHNYFFWLHKSVKYLRLLGEMHPAEHTLHDEKSFDEDIP